MNKIITNKDIIEQDTDTSGDNNSDCIHWGGFRVGDKISPLEGDASGIIRAVSSVANSVINNPQRPKPQAPQLQLGHNLQMIPKAPGMSSMGGGASHTNVVANNSTIQTIKKSNKSDIE